MKSKDTNSGPVPCSLITRFPNQEVSIFVVCHMTSRHAHLSITEESNLLSLLYMQLGGERQIETVPYIWPLSLPNKLGEHSPFISLLRNL